MSDILSEIFTDRIVERLRKSAADSLDVDFRFRVLSLADTNIAYSNSAPEQQLYFRTRQRWNLWIAAAASAGLFEQPHGPELRSRLTGVDSNGFRSALAECMTCWALSSELGLQIQPRPCGRDGRILEFAADTPQGEVFFEVKSPRFRGSALFTSETDTMRSAAEPVSRTPESAEGKRVREMRTYKDSGALRVYSAALAMRAALRAANRQFAPARRNILVLASPQIHSCSDALYEQWPASLVRAFYGEHHVMTTESDAGASQLSTEGNFLKQPGGVPRYTRISAAIGLQDLRFCSRVQAAVLHNPCSRQAVESSIFGQWIQFAAIKGEMRCSISIRDLFPIAP